MTKSTRLIFFLCLILLIFKILSVYLTSFDLFGDEAQYWLWSQRPDHGYYSKPPLLPWIIALVSFTFGNSIFALKMLPVFIYCFSSYIIFLISKKLENSSELAFLTATSFFLMPAVSFSSFFVSTDIVLIFFWSLALLQILTIKENPSSFNFILLGIFFGLAFMAKYAAIYLIICFAFLFFEKEMRNIFLKKKLSLLYFFLSAILIIAPNIIWNIENNWATLGHTVSNAGLERVSINFDEFLKFFVSQVIMIGPVIFFFFVLMFFNIIKNDFNTRFLIIFSLPVFFIILFESLLVRANANWAAVSLVSFLILFVHGVFRVSLKIIYVNNLFNFLLGLSFFFFIATSTSYGPFKRISNIGKFADSLLNNKYKHINKLVVGDRMLFSNLSYIFKNSEIVLYTPHTPDSRIEHHFQITNSLPVNFNQSFVFIGYPDQLNYLENKYDINLVETKDVVFKKEAIKIYEVLF